MFAPIRLAKSFLDRWLARQTRLPTGRTSKRVHLCFEMLEVRFAPATLSEVSPNTLSIGLADNESLAIVSIGNGYTFTSNQSFDATSPTNPTNQATAISGL